MTSVPIDHPKFQEYVTVRNTGLIQQLIYFGGKGLLLLPTDIGNITDMF